MGSAESYVEQYLKLQCLKNDILCFKFISPGISGVPDRVLIGNGSTVFVEVKKPGGTVRKLQKHIIAQMRNHGAHVRIIDTREGVDSLIHEIKTTPPPNT